MMNRSVLRIAIVVLTLITAYVHGVILGLQYSDYLFILNGLGYLTLLAALLLPVPFLAQNRKWIHYLFIGFTAVTILAWLIITKAKPDTLGYLTKLDELLLIVALWLHLRQTEQVRMAR
jgi:hypothetical protein